MEISVGISWEILAGIPGMISGGIVRGFSRISSEVLGTISRQNSWGISGWIPGVLPGEMAGEIPGWIPGRMPGKKTLNKF